MRHRTSTELISIAVRRLTRQGLDLGALVVSQSQPNSGRLLEVPDPPLTDGALLVQTMRMGAYGGPISRQRPEGPRMPCKKGSVRMRLRLGWIDLLWGTNHLGRVLDAPTSPRCVLVISWWGPSIGQPPLAVNPSNRRDGHDLAAGVRLLTGRRTCDLEEER